MILVGSLHYYLHYPTLVSSTWTVYHRSTSELSEKSKSAPFWRMQVFFVQQMADVVQCVVLLKDGELWLGSLLACFLIEAACNTASCCLGEPLEMRLSRNGESRAELREANL